jgi:hypothetical protein
MNVEFVASDIILNKFGVYRLWSVAHLFIWNSSQFSQPLPQLAIDWEDSSADAHFFLERTPARRMNTEKLRRQKLAAGTITVFIETDRFKPVAQYSKAATLNVAPKSDNTWELRELAFSGLARIYRPGYDYRRAGVTLGGLELADLVSKRLWADEWYERHRRLMAAIDRLNGKYGRDTVRCGIFPTEGQWRTRFAKRSPRYTTRWPEICEAMAK